MRAHPSIRFISGRYEPCCKCGTKTWEPTFCPVGSTALMSQCQNGSMSIQVLALCMYQGSLGSLAMSTTGCADSNIIWALDLREGKDQPQNLGHKEFDNIGKTMGILL